VVVREELEQNRANTAALSALVLERLADYFGSLDFRQPEVVRDSLLSFVPALVSQFGPVAEALALDWYDEQRLSAGSRGSFRAKSAPQSIPDEAVTAKVRYLAKHLWTPSPEDMLKPLSSAVDKYVKQPGRDAILWNANRENARWARVPSGAKTCAFCLVLASRDAIYLSERSAGSREHGNEFHGLCDCQIVRIARDEDYPPGYIPDDLYDIYEIGADKAGTRSDLKAIVFDLRRRFPDRFTDGVVDDDYIAQAG